MFANGSTFTFGELLGSFARLSNEQFLSTLLGTWSGVISRMITKRPSLSFDFRKGEKFGKESFPPLETFLAWYHFTVKILDQKTHPE